MYSQVLPLLDKFVKENLKDDGDGQNCIEGFPKFFGAGKINGDLVLVFEDILDGEQFVLLKVFCFYFALIGTDWFVTEKNVECKQELLHSRKQISVTLENLARYDAFYFIYYKEGLRLRFPDFMEPLHVINQRPNKSLENSIQRYPNPF